MVISERRVEQKEKYGQKDEVAENSKRRPGREAGYRQVGTRITRRKKIGSIFFFKFIYHAKFQFNIYICLWMFYRKPE